MPNDPQHSNIVPQEYKVLHEVAKALHTPAGMKPMLNDALKAITEFEGLGVEKKAGIFLVDEGKKTLSLFTTLGKFSKTFLESEKEVPFGDCLCGRVAQSGEMLMSESCFTDSRHERRYPDIADHGHYIVPLKSSNQLIGVMFLYTNTNPSWYKHSQEVLLSIGGLVADAMVRKRAEDRLETYKNQLEDKVRIRTQELVKINDKLSVEVVERRNFENKLRISKERLRSLSQRLQFVREEEKTRIAREVHDELGQALTALRIDILCMEKDLPPEQNALGQRIHSQVKLIENAIKSVQRICTELRPQILDVFGLCDAIAWQAEDYQSRTGIKFDLNGLQESIALDHDLTTNLFRIFQEASTNIFRHAQAKNVVVRLSQEQNFLTLEIRDDGVGIAKDQIEDIRSLGLIGMRERVLPWDGEVIIESPAGKGTSVRVKIPSRNR